jgi:hypothetical protein
VSTPPAYWLRDFKANGTRFLFADGWKKCFKGASALVEDEATATALVAQVLAAVDARDHVGSSYIPAWDITAEEFELADTQGRRWRISLFLDEGDTIVHGMKPAST